jgi:hypothetical protein
MLRKAVRFLVRSSRPPIMTATHSFIQGGGVSAAAAGTALKAPLVSSSKESQVGGATATIKEMGSAQDDGGSKSAELSLSALRLKHQACKELLAALEAIKATATASEASLASSSEREMLQLLGLPSPALPRR